MLGPLPPPGSLMLHSLFHFIIMAFCCSTIQLHRHGPRTLTCHCGSSSIQQLSYTTQPSSPIKQSQNTHTDVCQLNQLPHPPACLPRDPTGPPASPDRDLAQKSHRHARVPSRPWPGPATRHSTRPVHRLHRCRKFICHPHPHRTSQSSKPVFTSFARPPCALVSRPSPAQHWPWSRGTTSQEADDSARPCPDIIWASVGYS